jgi:hypothetical protein
MGLRQYITKTYIKKDYKPDKGKLNEHDALITKADKKNTIKFLAQRKYQDKLG